jgi:hypothetical protein
MKSRIISSLDEYSSIYGEETGDGSLKEPSFLKHLHTPIISLHALNVKAQ